MNITPFVAPPRLIQPSITLVSNGEEIICTEPAYHPRVRSLFPLKMVPSHLTAQPRSDLKFAEICYIPLKSGQRPVVVMPQKDGSIRMIGAYVDSIARELELTSASRAEESSDKSEDWMRAVDDGWQSHARKALSDFSWNGIAAAA